MTPRNKYAVKKSICHYMESRMGETGVAIRFSITKVTDPCKLLMKLRFRERRGNFLDHLRDWQTWSVVRVAQVGPAKDYHLVWSCSSYMKNLLMQRNRG